MDMTPEQYTGFIQHLADQVPENELNQPQGTGSMDMTIEEYAAFVASLMEQAEADGFTYE
jgi:methylaspartate ammonia-lyase